MTERGLQLGALLMIRVFRLVQDGTFVLAVLSHAEAGFTVLSEE